MCGSLNDTGHAEKCIKRNRVQVSSLHNGCPPVLQRNSYAAPVQTSQNVNTVDISGVGEGRGQPSVSRSPSGSIQRLSP